MKSLSKGCISNFVRYNRNRFKLKQEELAEKTGVGLRFLRELEQGKKSLRMDKVEQVLHFFGHRISSLPEEIMDANAILLNGLQKKIKIDSGRDGIFSGIIIGFRIKNHQILHWLIVSEDKLKEYKTTKHPSNLTFVVHADIKNWEPG